MNKYDNISKWTKIREKGILRYILINWLLIWSLPVAIISSIVGEFFDYKNINFSNFISRLLGISIIFIISGVILGIYYWNKQEKIWKRNNRR